MSNSSRGFSWAAATTPSRGFSPAVLAVDWLLILLKGRRRGLEAPLPYVLEVHAYELVETGCRRRAWMKRGTHGRQPQMVTVATSASAHRAAMLIVYVMSAVVSRGIAMTSLSMAIPRELTGWVSELDKQQR